MQQKQMDLCMFKASQVYKVSSRLQSEILTRKTSAKQKERKVEEEGKNAKTKGKRWSVVGTLSSVHEEACCHFDVTASVITNSEFSED